MCSQNQWRVRSISINFLLLLSFALNGAELPKSGENEPLEQNAFGLSTKEFPEFAKELMVFPEQASDREKRRYAKYFESLPSKLKRIILAHKMSCENKKCNQGLDRILILHGPPSSGKTEGCKAIAHKLNVPYIYFSAPSFGTTYQNSAVQNIKILIEPLLREELPLVVIIDEISALTKGADSDSTKNSETEQYKTSCSLNTLLDKIRQQENVLLLCTTNDVGFMTEPILQRSRLVLCESSPDARMEKLNDELLEDGSCLDEVAQDYLEEKKEVIANYTFRDVEQFIKSIKQICWEQQNFSGNNLIITKKGIKAALSSSAKICLYVFIK